MVLTEKNKQALIVGGILGGMILIIVLYFAFLYVMPGVSKANSEVAKLEQQIARQEKQIDDFETKLADQEAQRAIKEQFARIEQRLPSDQDPIEIFDLLNSYFEGSEVGFTYLEPGALTKRGVFTEFPFTIRGSARYHEFGQLVNLVECNPDRLMHVTSFELSNNPNRPSIHPMEIGIATFTFNE